MPREHKRSNRDDMNDLANIPQELKICPQWVCWRFEKRNEKLTKVPISPFSGQRASVNDPKSWNTFEKALKYTEIRRKNGIAGIGFVFTDEYPYCAVDLDNCRNPETGEIIFCAKKIIEVMDSYTEISPSGKGVHIIFRGKLPGSGRKNSKLGIEVYDSKRYFTLTGNVLDGKNQIHDRQPELEALMAEHFENTRTETNIEHESPATGIHAILSDEEIIERAIMKSPNGELLWEGDWEGAGYHSQSEADLALCVILAPYTGPDSKRINELFRKSGLYRKKWNKRYGDGSTYGSKTIQKCLSMQGDKKGKLIGYTANELLQLDFPEPTWAVPNLIPEGLTLLCGKPKVGKSWLALNTALAIACGGKALDAIPVEKGRVLYITLEDSPRRLKERLLSALQGSRPTDNLHLYTSWPRFDRAGLGELDSWINTHSDTRLIIIDPLEKIRQESKNNNRIYKEDYRALEGPKEIADKYGLAILIVHHLRKAKAESNDLIDLVSGTAGLTGASDTICILEKARGSYDAKFFITGRDVEETSLAIRFDRFRTCWCLNGSAEKFLLTPEKQEILEIFESNNGPLTLKEIAEKTGKKESNISNHLKKLVNGGFLEKVAYGKYILSRTYENNENNENDESGESGEI